MILRELQLYGLGDDDRIKGTAPVARWLGTTGGRMSHASPTQAEFLTVDEAAALLRVNRKHSTNRSGSAMCRGFCA